MCVCVLYSGELKHSGFACTRASDLYMYACACTRALHLCMYVCACTRAFDLFMYVCACTRASDLCMYVYMLYSDDVKHTFVDETIFGGFKA